MTSPVQVQTDNSTRPFILESLFLVNRDDQIILQDGGRSTPLLQKTLMAKIVAGGKWVPFTDETATDGTAIPRGIYMGPDILAADIVAGDVPDVLIYTGGFIMDEDQLIIENSKLLTTIINPSDATNKIFIQTVRDALESLRIYGKQTIAISEFEA